MSKPITFVATKYKDEPTQVTFCDSKGKLVSFRATKEIPTWQVPQI